MEGNTKKVIDKAEDGLEHEEIIVQAMLLWGAPVDHDGMTIWEALGLKWPDKRKVTTEEWAKVVRIKTHLTRVIMQLKECYGKEVIHAEEEGCQENGSSNTTGAAGGKEEGGGRIPSGAA